MKIAVIGSRNFDDFELLEQTIAKRLDSKFKDITVVSGGANGADKLGEKFADKYGLEKLIFPADWDTFGKRAGMIRNVDIINNADIVFAFWDGKSNGTKHGIGLAKEAGKELILVTFTPKPKKKPADIKELLKKFKKI